MKIITLDLRDKPEGLRDVIRSIANETFDKNQEFKLCAKDGFVAIIRADDGTLLTESEFKKVIEGCSDFYSNVTDDDVDTINTLRAISRQEREDEWRAWQEQSEKARKKGTVYVIRKPEDSLYKIGLTTNLKQRLYALKRQLNTDEVELVHSFDAEDAKAAERELHKRFQEKREFNEWFRLDEDDVAQIKELKSFKRDRFFS